MDNFAPHLPNPNVSLIGSLGLISLLFASDFSTDLCSRMLQLHCTISHLLSIESWLHTGREGVFLFARKEKLKHNQVS